MSGGEPTDCIFKGFTGTSRPDQEPDHGIAHDTQCCFLETSYNCPEIIKRVGAARKCNERQREPGNIPEIPSGSTKHHIGAETCKNTHADQEKPAILREQSNESDGPQ